MPRVTKLNAIYERLFAFFGSQKWWPGETAIEVVIGAVLTQNTSWKNVEKAISNLRAAGALSIARMLELSHGRLAALIRPSGYYNIKARRLKNLLFFLKTQYSGSLSRAAAADHFLLRRQLLSVNGIGRETADSILLYALGKPVFVVDAYTRRMLERHGFLDGPEEYDSVQNLFMQNLKCEVKLFNEYHALLVRLGKEFCFKNNPACGKCPLNSVKYRR